MDKYVWLNISKGEFSNSWTIKEVCPALYANEREMEDDLKQTPTNSKLIRFSCINDENFEFNHHMKLR